MHCVKRQLSLVEFQGSLSYRHRSYHLSMGTTVGTNPSSAGTSPTVTDNYYFGRVNGLYNTGRLLSDWNMGGIWAFGHPNWAGFSTIFPPNSPSCYERNNNNPSNAVGVFSVSSRQTGGVVI